MSTAVPPYPEAELERLPSLRERFVGMIVRPRETLEGLREPDAWFWPSILMLIGYTLFFLAYGVRSAEYTAATMGAAFKQSGANPNSAAGMVEQAMGAWLPVGMLFYYLLLVPFSTALSWATRTLLFYALARLLGGSRPFWGRVVAMVGWAWVPLFLQYAGVGLLVLLVPQASSFFIPFPRDGSQADPIATTRTQFQAQALLQVSPFVFWNLGLCILGVRQLFQLPGWKAAAVVLIPTVAYGLYQLANYLFAMLMFQWMSPSAPVPVPGSPAPR